MIRKSKTIAMVMVVCFLMSIPAFAIERRNTDNIINTMRMNYIGDTSAKLSISSGTATIKVQIEGYADIVDSVKIVTYIQRYENNAWINKETIAAPFNSNTGAINTTRKVDSGYEYRLTTYFYAYSGTDSESKTVITYAN